MRDLLEGTDVIIIGAGASGMMTAVFAASRGRRCVILEKNEKPGKKLYITGKGRCNLTNSCSKEEIFEHIVSNPRFMYSSMSTFDNRDVMDFFEGEGLRLKTERGGRVFPVSDHSSDVIKTLTALLDRLGVRIMTSTEVKSLILEDKRCTGVRAESRDNGKFCIYAESVIVATGGLSYPLTGSTGDGYRFALSAGLEVTERSPSLVPFDIKGDICGRLQGLTLKNILIQITDNKKTLYKSPDVGELLFTHFGVSGPLVLTASSEISPQAFDRDIRLHIDLKPALNKEELDIRVQKDFSRVSNREFRNSLSGLLPSKMIPEIIRLSGIDPSKKVHSVTKEERRQLVAVLKDLELDIEGLRGYDEAVVTKGGVSVKELDPGTFCSKKVDGLYFVGETVDVDAHTGGFNLQIAWSSGHAAGMSC